MDNEQENNIQAFMAKRPEYTERHVRKIAQDCIDDGIPFCRGCDDWHYTSEECSA